ncbi:MAG: alpha/beta hydrolase [bacterium]|nr:alpha/beta hydrolase [bacterium]
MPFLFLNDIPTRLNLVRIYEVQPRNFEKILLFCYYKDEMEEKNIILNNLLTHYYAWKNPGRGSCALLFLHGWRSGGAVWFPIIPALLQQTSCDIYTLDLPGFGKSQTPPSSFSLDDYREIIKAFVQKLGLARVVLVGHSFGGRITIKCATAYPNFFQKIVLVDSAGVRMRDKNLRTKNLIAKIVKPFFRLPLISRLRKPLYGVIGSEDYLATPELREVFVSIINEDLQPLLSGINAKTLIVWGENDDVTPIEAAEIMQKEIPHAELTILPDAGHFSFLDQKEKFINTLVQFLNI